MGYKQMVTNQSNPLKATQEPLPSPPHIQTTAKTKQHTDHEVKQIMARLVSGQSVQPKKQVRVSNERMLHGQEFDARVHALHLLLSSSHFAALLRQANTTPSQAKQLVGLAQAFSLMDSTFLYALLKFYEARGDVAEVTRVIELLRERAVPISEYERLLILRTQRKARLFSEGTLLGDVVRIWAQIGDADMCVMCYENMRAAGVHPGEHGFNSMLRLFRARADEAMCSRLLVDMASLGLDHNEKRSKTPTGAGGGRELALGLDEFKLLLRYHAELDEEFVCTRVLEEMRKHGIEEDTDIQTIIATMCARVKVEQDVDVPQLARSPVMQPLHPPRFSKHVNIEVSPTTFVDEHSDLSSNIPTQSLPPVSPSSNFEVQLRQWTKIKQDGGVPPTEFIHSFLHAASRESDCNLCEELLTAMDAHSIPHTAATYASVIEALKCNPVRCAELFATMLKQQLTPTTPTYNTMLWILSAQQSKHADACALFEEMKAKDATDTISYNTLMRMYSKYGNVQSVMLLSAQMKLRGIAHDTATYAIMVELLGKFGTKGMVVVDAVLEEIEASNFQADAVLCDTLMDVYGSMENWEKCERVWQKMKGKLVPGDTSCARFLQKHCHKDPSIYSKWKKEFSDFLPPYGVYF